MTMTCLMKRNQLCAIPIGKTILQIHSNQKEWFASFICIEAVFSFGTFYNWIRNAKNHFKDYIKYMQGGASYADIKTQFDSLNAENDNYYASNDNKRAELTGSNWESVTSEMDDLIFLEHGYEVKSMRPNSADQIKFGDIFRPVFDNTIKIDSTDFLDQMLNLNKPCPILDGKVVLFGRIRKTQEIISHNANHQNAAEEKNSQLKNSRFSQDRTSDFKNDLRGGYTDLEVVHDPLDSETEYLDQFRVQHSKEYYNIEGENSIRNYLGMISGIKINCRP